MHLFRMQDTIVAISSPPGTARCGIVRLSGPEAVALAERFFRAAAGGPLGDRPAGAAIQGRLQVALRVWERRAGTYMPTDEAAPCLAVFMRAPRSYTGEDIVEFHLPGAMRLLHAVVRTLCAAGARAAEAGEFTYRAFVNGRMDLGQAESVERLIAAGSERARRAALTRMRDDLGRTVAGWCKDLLQCAATVEAGLDFETDELDIDTVVDLQDRLASLAERCRTLCARAARGGASGGDFRVRLAGLTNAGKSSLANALLGRDACRVSPQASTTRDRLGFDLVCEGLRLRVEDAAGQDQDASGAAAWAAARALDDLDGVDLVCLVVDSANPRLDAADELLARLRGVSVVVALNKTDLPVGRNGLEAVRSVLLQRLADLAGERPVAVIPTSARTGAGVEDLRRSLVGSAGSVASDSAETEISAREQVELARAADACGRASELLRTHNALELVAEELRLAHATFDRTLGQGYAEEVLASIFARFCVGK